MIKFTHTGDFSKTIKFLSTAAKGSVQYSLDKFGRDGVEALSRSTPVDTGLTASSWYYEIESTKGKTVISWCNSNVQSGVPIAVILQYGHGTGNGGFIQGRDYINPAVRPIFDNITNLAWKEVTK